MNRLVPLFVLVFFLLSNTCKEASEKVVIPIANKICYKVNDTLFFESNKKGQDTFLITNISMERDIKGIYGSKNEMYSFNVYYNQLHSQEWMIESTVIRNNTKIISYSYPSLINIFYSKTTKYLAFDFSFKDFNAIFFGKTLEDSTLTDILVGDEIVKAYKIYGKNRQKNNSVKYIYWNNCFGVIAYEYMDGEMWKIKNNSTILHR